MPNSMGFMTEDEFVHADPETTQRWSYRILLGIKDDIKSIKVDVEALKINKQWRHRLCSFAGGVLGGVLAILMLKIKAISEFFHAGIN